MNSPGIISGSAGNITLIRGRRYSFVWFFRGRIVLRIPFVDFRSPEFWLTRGWFFLAPLPVIGSWFVGTLLFP